MSGNVGRRLDRLAVVWARKAARPAWRVEAEQDADSSAEAEALREFVEARARHRLLAELGIPDEPHLHYRHPARYGELVLQDLDALDRLCADRGEEAGWAL